MRRCRAGRSSKPRPGIAATDPVGIGRRACGRERHFVDGNQKVVALPPIFHRRYRNAAAGAKPARGCWLRACRDILGMTEIEARVVKVSSIVAGEWHENEIRKDFTPSERVAIGRAIEAQIKAATGERRERSEKAPDLPLTSKRAKKPQNLAELRGRESRDVAAERAGFGNRESYRQAAKVVEKSAPELVQAMDAGKVSISAAAQIADLPPDEQREIRRTFMRGRRTAQDRPLSAPVRQRARDAHRTAQDGRGACPGTLGLPAMSAALAPSYGRRRGPDGMAPTRTASGPVRARSDDRPARFRRAAWTSSPDDRR